MHWDNAGRCPEYAVLNGMDTSMVQQSVLSKLQMPMIPVQTTSASACIDEHAAVGVLPLVQNPEQEMFTVVELKANGKRTLQVMMMTICIGLRVT